MAGRPKASCSRLSLSSTTWASTDHDLTHRARRHVHHLHHTTTDINLLACSCISHGLVVSSQGRGEEACRRASRAQRLAMVDDNDSIRKPCTEHHPPPTTYPHHRHSSLPHTHAAPPPHHQMTGPTPYCFHASALSTLKAHQPQRDCLPGPRHLTSTSVCAGAGPLLRGP